MPGIQGTGLEDYYPIPSEELWSAILHKAFERLALCPLLGMDRQPEAGA